MTAPSSTPTQKDVAKKLGVSQEWVSRALSGDRKVSATSRARVEAAARELGYVPEANAEARSLAGKRHGRRALTQTLGCLQFDLDQTSYWAQLMNAIQGAVHRRGQEILMLSDKPSVGWERVDGIIGHAELALDRRTELPVSIPFVSIFAAQIGISSIEVDDYLGAHQAARHLIELGHRRVGYLLDATDRNYMMQHRLAGYRTALRAARIEPRPEWERYLGNCGEFVVRGRKGMTEWLANGFRESGITGLLVQNDRAAVGAMQSLQEAGLRVPRDVSIVGFDSTQECELSSPRLTSVRVPLEELGATAVEMLLSHINDENAPTQTKILPLQLEVRDSTAPPPVEARSDHS